MSVPKGRASGLPTTSAGSRFHLWALGFFCTERHLAKRLKNNSFYPFTQQQPGVFVLEYYLDTLWKGMLLFVVCLILVCSGFVRQVEKQETWGFPAYGMVVGLWLMISSLPRRRLVLNHTRGIYHFSIQGRTVCQGSMHLVYVRLALSSDAYGRCFFQLVLCGHKLEPLVLVQLSERYEQMEYLGRHIARKLNINYFDYLASSYRHVVRHWPLGASFSPGIVLRKKRIYSKPSSSQSDLDV
ncbi:LOW QUALITY PROTEIN: cation channel sperm-associated auxiliary subunit TMEM249 [Sciurus carolinensis]|uniref:LOW QUALITY PROTEIN: cation channel sperm-associated auxiliary subunit TMEM249 n=1 Tax=Sciurus carolinensis TaxID=30640 RepID=UPI001FB344C0|nr:LOW QUALITY PROTEIN: cation channel sperm-associated auxiliary subunit TMEM249 [Sciurus carolinensis]